MFGNEVNCWLESSICGCTQHDERQARFQWFEDIPPVSLNTRALALEFIRTFFAESPKEHLFVLFLDKIMSLKHLKIFCSGSVDEVQFKTSEIFREGLGTGASSFILIHNHPSGDPTPSPTDIRLTRRLRLISEEMDMPLLDHVIISATGVRSVGLWESAVMP